MEKGKFRTYDDIVKYLEFSEKEYNETFEELNKNRRTEYKRKLINCIVSYDQCDKFLKDSTTFRRQDLVRFLVDYFSVVYNKKYVFESGVTDKKQNNPVISYDLIVSEEDLIRFKGDKDILRSVNFEEFFDRCNDCCLLLDNSLKFTLLDGVELSSDFKDFPELMAVVRKLVNLKLSNPEMSDQRRLMIILSDTCLDFDGGSCEIDITQRLEKTYHDYQ